MAEVTQCELTAMNIPIKALSATTIETISVLLDPVKVIPNDEGLPRYWRGLAHIIGLQGDTVSLINSKKDPTNQVLKWWTAGTIEKLKTALKQLDRWDIIDDTAHMMDTDINQYLTETKENSSISSNDLNLSLDKQIITIGDVNRLERGLVEPQYYHAFLLYADEDHDFASQIVNKMENEFGLKLCIRDRDLVGGLAFEHEAIMRLIKERCNRLIVIVSPYFLKSEANKFFVTFAQALGIGQRERKVVPCLYQHCDLPPELSYYFLLDYTRPSKLWDFWSKLRDSIQTPILRNQALPIKVKEMEGNECDEAVHKVTCSIHDSVTECCAPDNTGSAKSDLQTNNENSQEKTKSKSKNFIKRNYNNIIRKQKLKKKAE